MNVEEARPYAPVLERMIELLGDKKNAAMGFGEALERAKSETGIAVPEEIEGRLLISAFKVIASGKIPGLAEA